MLLLREYPAYSHAEWLAQRSRSSDAAGATAAGSSRACEKSSDVWRAPAHAISPAAANPTAVSASPHRHHCRSDAGFEAFAGFLARNAIFLQRPPSAKLVLA